MSEGQQTGEPVVLRRSRRANAGNRMAAVLLQERIEMNMNPEYGKMLEAEDDEEYTVNTTNGDGGETSKIAEDDDDDDLDYGSGTDGEEGWEKTDDEDDDGDAEGGQDGQGKRTKMTAEEREAIRAERSSTKRKKNKTMFELMEEKARRKRVRKEAQSAVAVPVEGETTTAPEADPAASTEGSLVPATPDFSTPPVPSPTGTTSTNPPGSATPTTKRKRESRVSWLSEATPLRLSTRASTQKSRAKLLERLQQRERHRQNIITAGATRAEAANPKTGEPRPTRRTKGPGVVSGESGAVPSDGTPRMTQEDRLARAAEIERLNSVSLRDWQEEEEKKAAERRERIRAMRSREVQGPKVRFWSGQAVWVEDVVYVGKSKAEITRLEEERRRERARLLKAERERERQRQKEKEKKERDERDEKARQEKAQGEAGKEPQEGDTVAEAGTRIESNVVKAEDGDVTMADAPIRDGELQPHANDDDGEKADDKETPEKAQEEDGDAGMKDIAHPAGATTEESVVGRDSGSGSVPPPADGSPSSNMDAGSTKPMAEGEEAERSDAADKTAKECTVAVPNSDDIHLSRPPSPPPHNSTSPPSSPSSVSSQLPDAAFQSLLASCSLLYLDHPDLPIQSSPSVPVSGHGSTGATTSTAATQPSSSVSRPSARQAAARDRERDRDREASARKVLEHLLGYDPYLSPAGHTISIHNTQPHGSATNGATTSTTTTTRSYNRASHNQAPGSAATGLTQGHSGSTAATSHTPAAPAATTTSRRGNKQVTPQSFFTPGHRVSACIAGSTLTCPITNKTAQYRDPLTGLAYRDRLAYGCLRKLVGRGPMGEIERAGESDDGEDGDDDDAEGEKEGRELAEEVQRMEDGPTRAPPSTSGMGGKTVVSADVKKEARYGGEGGGVVSELGQQGLKDCTTRARTRRRRAANAEASWNESLGAYVPLTFGGRVATGVPDGFLV